MNFSLEGTVGLTDMPDEILVSMATMLDLRSAARFAKTCRRFRSAFGQVVQTVCRLENRRKSGDPELYDRYVAACGRRRFPGGESERDHVRDYRRGVFTEAFANECYLEVLAGVDSRRTALSVLSQTKLIPPEIGSAESLSSVHLGGTGLMELPGSIGLLRNLKLLTVYGNSLVSLPDELFDLKDLELLDLSNNKDLVLPKSGFSRLGKLQELRLSALGLSEEKFPSDVGSLVSLTSIDLSNNRFASLPDSLGELERLAQADCSGNLLTEFPEPLFALATLEMVRLNSNRIESIGTGVGRLERLESLELGYNRLRSYPEHACLGTIRHLNLEGNMLTGVPAALCHMTFLSTLSISNNLLKSFPRELERLPLVELDVSGNRIDVVPEGIFGSTSLALLNIRRNGIRSLPFRPTCYGVRQQAMLVCVDSDFEADSASHDYVFVRQPRPACKFDLVARTLVIAACVATAASVGYEAFKMVCRR